MTKLAELWYRHLLNGSKNYSQVPAKYKNDVNELLDKAVKDGVITEEELEEIKSR